ncbi:RNA polymerase sigma-70 factor [Prolixibacteraceae bacterium JC049]|nr:RNA polymerase sigma-70 factor [Prolixibacteraceae bacterium JC049]
MFFDNCFTRLHQFATTFITSEAVAEEIVMDQFVKLWEQRSNLDKINNIETYLFVSVRNSCLNALKKNSRYNFDMLDEVHVELIDYKPSAENSMIQEEMVVALNKAVAQLPSKCKIIFKLIREEGLNRNEVAEILDISVKTVDNQVAIAVRKIAEHLNIDLSLPKKKNNFTHFLLSL